MMYKMNVVAPTQRFYGDVHMYHKKNMFNIHSFADIKLVYFPKIKIGMWSWHELYLIAVLKPFFVCITIWSRPPNSCHWVFVLFWQWGIGKKRNLTVNKWTSARSVQKKETFKMVFTEPSEMLINMV